VKILTTLFPLALEVLTRVSDNFLGN
jgi:hypothetical protein